MPSSTNPAPALDLPQDGIPRAIWWHRLVRDSTSSLKGIVLAHSDQSTRAVPAIDDADFAFQDQDPDVAVRALSRVYREARRAQKGEEAAVAKELSAAGKAQAEDVLSDRRLLAASTESRCDWVGFAHTCPVLAAVACSHHIKKELEESSPLKHLSLAWQRRHASIPPAAPTDAKLRPLTTCFQQGLGTCKRQHARKFCAATLSKLRDSARWS